MKILMTKSWNEPEYLDDGLLHGLRSIFGSDVVEYPRMWHMYADSFGFGKKDLSSICARGFTYYGRMEDPTVDRTDLENKIALKSKKEKPVEEEVIQGEDAGTDGEAEEESPAEVKAETEELPAENPTEETK